jgi:hypothetical protein
MLLHEWRDFSWPMRYIAQKFPLTRVSEREPLLERLPSSLQVLQTVPPPNHSPHEFLSLPRLLGLNRTLPSFGGCLESYDHNGTNYSVLSCYWVAPQVRSILLNNEIDGLMTDTSFRVMRQYYTAIPVAVNHNVGIPLAISFGPRESSELYDAFYQAFHREFGFKLKDYILESDQGSAVKAVGRGIRAICSAFGICSRICALRIAVDLRPSWETLSLRARKRNSGYSGEFTRRILLQPARKVESVRVPTRNC